MTKDEDARDDDRDDTWEEHVRFREWMALRAYETGDWDVLVTHLNVVPMSNELREAYKQIVKGKKRPHGNRPATGKAATRHFRIAFDVLTMVKDGLKPNFAEAETAVLYGLKVGTVRNIVREQRTAVEDAFARADEAEAELARSDEAAR